MLKDIHLPQSSNRLCDPKPSLLMRMFSQAFFNARVRPHPQSSLHRCGLSLIPKEHVWCMDETHFIQDLDLIVPGQRERGCFAYFSGHIRSVMNMQWPHRTVSHGDRYSINSRRKSLDRHHFPKGFWSGKTLSEWPASASRSCCVACGWLGLQLPLNSWNFLPDIPYWT